MYHNYVKARNTAWKVLLECEIKELPINLQAIADYYHIPLITYSEFPLTQLFKPEVVSGDGFATSISGTPYIILNDQKSNRYRRRFTVAHELGHILLNHPSKITFFRNSEIDHPYNIEEIEANIFARDLLMPATVLASLHLHSPEQIMKFCHISYTSAVIRAKRMQLLYQRNSFDIHPLEKEVHKQFSKFIEENQ